MAGGVTESTARVSEVEGTAQALTTADVDRVLGFEATTVSDWVVIQSGPGTLSVSTTASQGSHSLAVTSHGYVPVQSVALSSLGSRVGSAIHVDIMLPSQLKQISAKYYGAAQLYVNIPSLGVNNASLGQVDLTGLPLGQWNTLTFTASSSVLSKLRGTYSDLTVTVAVNAPYNATQPYLLDNLRFSDSTLALVTVVDGNGYPISGVTVGAWNGSTATSYSGVSDSSGLAKVWVPPGSYRFGVTDSDVTTYSSPTNQCQVPDVCIAVMFTDRCHGVVCGAKDSCHNAGTCAPSTGKCSNPAKPVGTVCRAAAGPCDIAEVCDGTDAGCPGDTLVVQGAVCRGAAGLCDVDEVCSGTSADCPDDSFAPSSSVCRKSSGLCDPAETCTGSGPNCPDDVLADTTVVCRQAIGVCDLAEYCTGASPSCPDDGFLPSSSQCRQSAGPCDPAETCTGSGPDCPVDLLSNSATLCRDKAGDCDVAEYCTGTDPACPNDSFAPSSSVCRKSAGPCDLAENCTGSSAACPTDVLASSTTVCRPSAGACDVAENCTGSSAACPLDVLAGSTTVCRPATGPCDLPETCTGNSLSCPDDKFATASTVCSADGTRTCDGGGHCLTECGPAAEPGPHEVMVFCDADYSGTCKTFAVEANQAHSYVPDLVPHGVNDCISSLKVGANARLHAFVDADYSAMCSYSFPFDSIAKLLIPLGSAYVPDPSLSDAQDAKYDMGDNPIDLITVELQSGTKYADQATYEPNAKPRNHAQMGPNIGDGISSLIIDNLDLVGNTEPLASSFRGNYPGSADSHTFWTDGSQGLCHNHDYWFISQHEKGADWATGVSDCVAKVTNRRLGRIWRCPLDCDLNTSPLPDISSLWGGFYRSPTTHAPVLGPGSCESCISKSLYDYSKEWLAASPDDVKGGVFGEYDHFGDPDRATVNGTDYVLIPVEPCNPDGYHDSYILVLDVNLNYVARWFIPSTKEDGGVDPNGQTGAWVAVRPGSNEIWTSYDSYLLNVAYDSSNPFYSADNADWSGNHVQNGLLVFDPKIWNNPAGDDPRGIQTLSFLRAPVITGLRGYPVSMMTAQGGVFSPSGKVLYLSAGYAGNESKQGVVSDVVCWALDCDTKNNDYGVLTAIDADSGRVLGTSGDNVGPFNFQVANVFNTNEPEGLDFFDTACYAADHGGQPPTGFGLTQLHAILNNDNLLHLDGVYLKHYTGPGLGSSCDSGFGSDSQKVQAVVKAAHPGGYCSIVPWSTSFLACSDFETSDETSWVVTQGGEGAWAIRSDNTGTTDSTYLLEKSSDNSWHDQETCGSPTGFPQDRHVFLEVQLNTSISSSDDQGAALYGLYQDADNAYYAFLSRNGTVSLRKRVGGVDSTIASVTGSVSNGPWSSLSIDVHATTDTWHGPAGGLWVEVALSDSSLIAERIDSAPSWPGACVGVGTYGAQAGFDAFWVAASLVTSP